MRLLNATTQPLQFETFYYNIPPYAILSHTWGAEDEEATFQDIQGGTGRHKPGYQKIKACCEQAVCDGLRYVWIDTYCIDKTNSVELQEAINSMFNWYKRSTICYAYLFDYEAQAEMIETELFRASKWFTRGWTLQELIAPAKMEFYNRKWACIGSRTGLEDLISSITRISTEFLGGEDLELSSVAQRMSWASMRKTTRAEDMAYCLLGIFGVHMPLIYGEGGKEAFIRLQKAIMEQSDDQSLFAWKQDHGVVLGASGPLATSPAMFAHSSSLVSDLSSKNRSAYRMTNRGLEIRLLVTRKLCGGDLIALLHCNEWHGQVMIGISVAPLKDGRFVRTNPDKLNFVGRPIGEKYKKPTLETLYIPQLYLPEKPPQPVFRFRIRDVDSEFEVPQKTSWVKRMSSSITPSSIPNFSSTDKTMTWCPALATCRADRSRKGTLHFAMQVGGMAGVLLVPSDLSYPPASSTPSFTPQLVAVIVGVNLEGLPYGMIINLKELEWKSLAEDKSFHQWLFRHSQSPLLRLDEAGESPWFDKFVLEHPVDASGNYVEEEIQGMVFSVEVELRGVNGALNKNYSVYISYRRKSEI